MKAMEAWDLVAPILARYDNYQMNEAYMVVYKALQILEEKEKIRLMVEALKGEKDG